ncbi:MAG: energy transducer TonB [Sandaracinaceae bacterium]|nr:energy transducer TonB [Sandaracinaceae bacterium]
MLSGCSVPERPDSLEGATAETITIYVRLVIGPDGRVLRARIETSHPLVPDETILACVQTRMFEPAHLPDGTAVPYPLRYAFTFPTGRSLTASNEEIVDIDLIELWTHMNDLVRGVVVVLTAQALFCTYVVVDRVILVFPLGRALAPLRRGGGRRSSRPATTTAS